ncbi:hypothetical protein CHS0354_000756 [Potamilus streckersoni]|uniref:Thioredoxin domain-containing protein n=1 Tax=Potamilus streckersoni TaxID=2493646 RepID=A0AAE0T854_9BIVA|nr:hypothetical protein CHS0354_000756 [Potamilus streckersoni]
MDIYLNFDRPVSLHELEFFRALSKRRILGEPLQYILGHETFYGLKFNVNPSVLIPRPETELLIDIALDKLNAPEIIVDACSGSGVLGIVLAKKFPASQVIAIEISPAAIEIAKKNAIQHNINNIEFLQLDILHTSISNYVNNVDALICNPPYIAVTEKNTLQKEINFEPDIALFTETGLEFYEKISSEINSILKPNGTLLFEIHSEKENENDQTQLYGCYVVKRKVRAENPEQERVAAVGKAAPLFSLKNVLGQTVSLADLKGKVVVLEWSNPGCPFVKGHYENGNLPSLQKKYRGKSVEWILINSTNKNHKDYSEGSNLKAKFDAWKSAYSQVLLDQDGTVGKLYDAKTTPHMFIIDALGTLVYKGAVDDYPSTEGGKDAKINYVSKALDEVLAGKAVTISETQAYGCSVKYKGVR